MVKQKRPILISIFAGWLMSCSVFGAVVFSVVLPQVNTIQNDGSEFSMWVVDRLGRYGILTICLFACLFAFCFGWGLWNLQPWSRKAMLCVSGIFAATYVCWAMLSYAHRSFGDALGIFLCAIIFSLPLYYLNRSKIKDLFASKSQNAIGIATQD